MTIEELELGIIKYNRLADIGAEIYRYNGVGEFMHNSIFYNHMAHKLEKLLNEQH